MTLISLLLIMALERVTAKSPAVHIHAIAGRYITKLRQKGYLSVDSGTLPLLLVIALPALVVAIVTWVIDATLFTFLTQLAVLWVCLGCPMTRKSYKQYLQAANRNDFQACSLHSIALGNENGDLNKVGQQLVFVNYRQYAALIIAFVLMGVSGVIIYSLAKELQLYMHQQADCDDPAGNAQASQGDDNDKLLDVKLSNMEVSSECVKQGQHLAIDQIMAVLDWLPVRITGLGFLIVGHFTRALGVWLPSLFDLSSSAKTVLIETATAAEDVDPDPSDVSSEACTLVRLAKRNITFMLVSVSLLTLVGAVS